MDVKTYSMAKDAKKKLSAHFRVEEFRSKDNDDTVLISQRLVEMLEKLRSKLGCTVNINSGYRTKTHNRNVGGSLTSKHCLGLAADIVCRRGDDIISAKEVCCAAQSLGFPGIGYISARATHLDVRDGKWWADESRKDRLVEDFFHYFGMESGEECPYSEPLSPIRRGSRGEGVRWMQWHLIKRGFSCGESGIDGSCGRDTEKAILAFQKAMGLSVDGVCGPKTRDALKSS